MSEMRNEHAARLQLSTLLLGRRASPSPVGAILHPDARKATAKSRTVSTAWAPYSRSVQEICHAMREPLWKTPVPDPVSSVVCRLSTVRFRCRLVMIYMNFEDSDGLRLLSAQTANTQPSPRSGRVTVGWTTMPRGLCVLLALPDP